MKRVMMVIAARAQEGLPSPACWPCAQREKGEVKKLGSNCISSMALPRHNQSSPVRTRQGCARRQSVVCATRLLGVERGEKEQVGKRVVSCQGAGGLLPIRVR